MILLQENFNQMTTWETKMARRVKNSNNHQTCYTLLQSIT